VAQQAARPGILLLEVKRTNPETDSMSRRQPVVTEAANTQLYFTINTVLEKQ